MEFNLSGMDLFTNYFNSGSLFPFEYIIKFQKYINENPVSSVLAPITLTLLCYYVYVYIRKFYPICVNCWFCNSNFKVAFEDRYEFTCVDCGQFNGFKEDGNYSKIIPEQYDQRHNRTIFTVFQNIAKENKNGLCHKCNIIQEMKVKQLASFTPTKEKNFDKEIEKFKENLENASQLCSKCNMYTKKVLSLQEQRYNLKSIRMSSQINKQTINDWPNICSLCFSFIIFLLSSGTEKYLSDWAAKFIDSSITHYNFITITRSIGIICIAGLLCQIYQCLSTMSKLSAIVMLCWSSLFALNNFKVLENFKPQLLSSVVILLLSLVSILQNLTKKQKIRQTSIKLEDENNQFPITNDSDLSSNGSVKDSDESQMMDIDNILKSPKGVKNMLNKTVNNLFEGMKLNDNYGARYNIIQPPKLFIPAKRDKFEGYAQSSPGYYMSYSLKDNNDYDTQSIHSQRSYKSSCSSICHQPVSPYTCYAHHHQPSSLNLSHSSNTSNIQPTSEWSKMLIYSIPGIILLAMQCYLLYDIKDFMKQK